MPKALPGDWASRIQNIAEPSPWAWCWEVEAYRDGAARYVFRATSYDEELTITDPDTSEFGGTKTFRPHSIQQSDLEENAQNSLPQLQLTISTTATTLFRYFEQGSGFMGRRAFGYLVNVSNVASFRRFDWTVRAATVNALAATLRLELPPFFEIQFPEDRFVPQRCRWRFGSLPCPYVINAAAAYTTCGKDLADCQERDLDMRARNLAPSTVAAWGGFPGVLVR